METKGPGDARPLNPHRQNTDPTWTPTPTAELTIPSSGNALVFISAPAIPSFMHDSPFISRLFLSSGQKKERLDATTQVLKLMGASESQIASLAKDESAQNAICTFFCGKEPLIEMMRQDGDLVFTVSPQLTLNELHELVKALQKHGMPVHAAGLLAGGILNYDHHRGNQRRLLEQLAALLHEHPGTVLPQPCAGQLQYLVQEVHKNLDDACSQVLLRCLRVMAAATPAQRVAMKEETALKETIDLLPKLLPKDPAAQRDVLDRIYGELLQLQQMAELAHAEGTWQSATNMIIELGERYPAVEANKDYRSQRAQIALDEAYASVKEHLPKLEFIHDAGHGFQIQVASTDVDKKIDAGQLLAYLRASTGIPGSLRANQMTAYIAHAKDAFTRAATRDLWVRHAASNPLDVNYAIEEWLKTVTPQYFVVSAKEIQAFALKLKEIFAPQNSAVSTEEIQALVLKLLKEPLARQNSTVSAEEIQAFALELLKTLAPQNSAVLAEEIEEFASKWSTTLPPHDCVVSAEEIQAFASMCTTASDADAALVALGKMEATQVGSAALDATNMDIIHARLQICSSAKVSQAVLQDVLTDILESPADLQALEPAEQASLLQAALQLNPKRLNDVLEKFEGLLANRDGSPNVLGAMLRLLCSEKPAIDEVLAEVRKWPADAKLSKSVVSHLFLPLVSALVDRLAPDLLAQAQKHKATEPLAKLVDLIATLAPQFDHDAPYALAHHFLPKMSALIESLAPDLIAVAQKYGTTEPLKMLAALIGTLARQFHKDAPYELMTELFDSLAASSQGMAIIDALIPLLPRPSNATPNPLLYALVVMGPDERKSANMMLAACLAAKAMAQRTTEEARAILADTQIADNAIANAYFNLCLHHHAKKKGNTEDAKFHLKYALQLYAHPSTADVDRWHEAATDNINTDVAGTNARNVRDRCNDFAARRRTTLFDPDDGVLHALRRLDASAANRAVERPPDRFQHFHVHV